MAPSSLGVSLSSAKSPWASDRPRLLLTLMDMGSNEKVAYMNVAGMNDS